MSSEILLLVVLCSLTVVAYMIAINAHGSVRLSISYLFATLLLAVSVYCVVEQVNASANREKLQALKQVEQLEIEKQKTEELLRSKEQTLQQSKEQTAAATQLNSIITAANVLANKIRNVNLRASDDLDPLLAQANSTRSKVLQIKNDFDKLNSARTFFPESYSVVREAIEKLVEAARYYATYYHSEDAVQERERERLMRARASEAIQGLERATELIAQNR